MLFNSAEYLLFLPVVFIIYWLLSKRVASQNIFLVIASYFFYGCWNWRFLFLLAFSTGLDYFTGLQIYNANSSAKRRLWLVISVGINLGFLGIFKYYNFFVHSFAELLSLFGLHPDFVTLNIILPVGISFYTFHGLSYVIDVYNKRISPTTNVINYTLFVSFFPLLVAGPIERATHLLPQVEKPRVFYYQRAVDGLRQILWGMFKKVVIADNCAGYIDTVFNNSQSHTGSSLVIASVLFAVQIYGDFSGYSDIALGTARLLGFELLKNFSFPYFSRDIAEFWRRWHISLSSWFKDYLYIPLGGSKGGNWMRIRNTFIIFLVSGFWHGANWTFIIWGGLNALFILPSIILGTNRNNLDIVAKGKTFPGFKEGLAMVLTFGLTVFAWIFFRAASVGHAFQIIKTIFSASLIKAPYHFSVILLVLIAGFFIIEWLGRENNYAIEKLGFRSPRLLRWAIYSLIIFFIGLFMQTDEMDFIYFQF